MDDDRVQEALFQLQGPTRMVLSGPAHPTVGTSGARTWVLPRRSQRCSRSGSRRRIATRAPVTDE